MAKKSFDIAVCVPSGGRWEPDFGLSLVAMALHFSQIRVPGATAQTLSFINTRGSMLPQNRENLFRTAIRQGRTHILWLDDDMRFPKNTLHRLLHWRQVFVAAQGVTKKIPAEPTAIGFDGKRVFSDRKKKGIERVEHVGLAVALLQLTEEVKAVGAPAFEHCWEAEAQAYTGEDVTFCRHLARKGVKLFVDHDLSRQIDHVGSFRYNHSVVGEIVRENGEGRAAPRENGNAEEFESGTVRAEGGKEQGEELSDPNLSDLHWSELQDRAEKQEQVSLSML